MADDNDNLDATITHGSKEEEEEEEEQDCHVTATI
jgi:hypothetical protein